jgi:hypothetical protein
MSIAAATFALTLALALAGAPAPKDSNRLFHLEAYQDLGNPWLAAAGDGPLLPAPLQARRAAAFRRACLGPWDRSFVAAHLTVQVATLEARVLSGLRRDIGDRSGFGFNARPYGPAWLDRISALLPPARPGRFHFRPGDRAVTLDNAPVRLLPTTDLYLRHPELPGQGYPFDTLQNSVLWAGTPVYLLERTRDRAWCKVLAADCAGWIRSQELARADGVFVRRWRGAARRRGLAAAIVTEAPVTDTRGRFRFQAYVGSVFPLLARGPRPAILIPVRDHRTHRAVGIRARLPRGAGVPQPWPYTPRHAAALWRTLLGRPYGWGNLRLLNDCSAELKNFFVPFGLWLPRHSSDQRDAGRAEDLSALDLHGRLDALARTGRPYLTLVWIPGHVMLYLGPLTYTAPDGAAAAGFMSYQNLWGLRPKVPPDYRAIVGGAALFPVLDRYPDQPELRSQADLGGFVATRLDQPPVNP